MIFYQYLMEGAINILCVCTGNICRSPMAEGLIKKLVAREGLEGAYEISSAGTRAVEQSPAVNEVVNMAKDIGVDLSQHIARQLTNELAEEADIILVMEESHRLALIGMDPKFSNKTHLLTAFNPNIPDASGIDDPIGGPPFHYRDCIGKIFESLNWFIKELKADSGKLRDQS